MNAVYNSPVLLARITIGLMMFLLACEVITVIPDVMTLALGQEFLPLSEGENFSPEDLLALVFGIVALVYVAVFLVTATFFLCWQYRCHKNAEIMGAFTPRFSAGMGVWSYFIPILCLFRPYQEINNLWEASSKELSNLEHGGMLVKFWWGLWILNGIIGQVSLRLEMAQDTPAMITAGVGLLEILVSIPLTILACQVVWKLTRRFESRQLVVKASQPVPV